MLQLSDRSSSKCVVAGLALVASHLCPCQRCGGGPRAVTDSGDTHLSAANEREGSDETDAGGEAERGSTAKDGIQSVLSAVSQSVPRLRRPTRQQPLLSGRHSPNYLTCTQSDLWESKEKNTHSENQRHPSAMTGTHKTTLHNAAVLRTSAQAVGQTRAAAPGSRLPRVIMGEGSGGGQVGAGAVSCHTLTHMCSPPPQTPPPPCSCVVPAGQG